MDRRTKYQRHDACLWGVLGYFEKQGKVTINFIMPVCLSVRLSFWPHGKLGFQRTDFHEISHSIIFETLPRKFKLH